MIPGRYTKCGQVAVVMGVGLVLASARVVEANEYLDAPTVFVFHIERIQVASDKQVAAGSPEVLLVLVVDSIVRGTLRQSVGSSFSMTLPFRQFWGPPASRKWTTYPFPKAGESFVAFCDDSSNEVSVLIAGERCQPFASDASVADDMRLVLDLERRHASLAEVLAAAREGAATSGRLLTSYLRRRVNGQPIDADVIGAVIAILEAPRVNPTLRAAVDFWLAGLLLSAPAVHQKLNARYVRALFRVMQLSDAESERRNFPRSRLDDELGLHQGAWRLTVEEVFRGYESERAGALLMARSLPDSEWKQPLLDWFSASRSMPRRKARLP